MTDTSAPAQIRPNLAVVPFDWVSRIPPSGAVNAPEFLTSVYPGQKVAVAVVAQGADRDALLKNCRLRVRFRVGSTPGPEQSALKPTAIRRIKAEGADFAVLVLKAAGISDADRSKLEAGTSFVTFAVFAPDWTVPAGEDGAEVEINAEVSGGPTAVVIEPVRLKIRTTSDWLKQPAPTEEEFEKQMNRYRGDVAPGQLLSWFTVAAKGRGLKAAPVQAFFVFAFKANPAARTAAVESYAMLDPEIQPALLWVLRLGGQDLKHLFPSLPTETLAPYLTVAPLSDPQYLPHFKDPVEPQAVSDLGNAMDRCWGAWMATGEPRYLRALVDLLGGAPDLSALKAWQGSRGGAKGLNAKVARGLAYQIAGWSIGSFERTDPHVTDWLLYWQNDPTVPAAVRQEIAGLPTNPAFRK